MHKIQFIISALFGGKYIQIYNVYVKTMKLDLKWYTDLEI